MGLVYSREVGQSYHIESSIEIIIVTVVKVSPGSRTATLSVSRKLKSADAGMEQVETVVRAVGGLIQLNADSTLTLVDVYRNKARFEFIAPRETSIHRLEIWQAMEGGRQTRNEHSFSL